MFSLNISEILIKQGKSAYWLSKATGISPNNIGNIVNNETKNIRFSTLEKICLALNCTPNDLFISDDPKMNHLLNSDN